MTLSVILLAFVAATVAQAVKLGKQIDLHK